jgi:hypothetical protein
LSFVLTLALSDTGRLGNDLDRARILLDSFVHFVDPGDVGDFLVVVPQKDMDNVQQELASYQRRLSIVILDETVVAPSLSYYPDTTNDWPRPNKGWYRQHNTILHDARQRRYREEATPFGRCFCCR